MWSRRIKLINNVGLILVMSTTFDREEPETNPEFEIGGRKRTAVCGEDSSSVDICTQRNRKNDRGHFVGVYVRPREKMIVLDGVSGRVDTYSFIGLNAGELDKLVLEELDELEQLDDPLGNKVILLNDGVFQHCYPLKNRETIQSRIERLNKSFYE